MTILYVNQSGSGDYVYTSLPEFAKLSVMQSRHFHKGPIVFICEQPEEWFAEYQVTWINVNDFVVSEYRKFVNELRPNETEFWNLTMMRMLIIEDYMKIVDDDVLFLEYDNLIYHDVEKLNPFFDGKVRYCAVSDSEYSPGIMMFPKNESDRFFNEFRKIAFDEKQRLTDMTILRKLKDSENVSPLPILPCWDADMLFDGASYGQWYGGTNNGHAEGFTDPNHFIGQAIKSGTLTLGKEMPPQVMLGDVSYPIFNLHIHSKKLEQFIWR